MVLLHCETFIFRFEPSCWALQIDLVQRSQIGLDRGQIGLFPQGTQIAEEMASPAFPLHIRRPALRETIIVQPR